MKADRSAAAPVFNIQSYCIHDGPGIRVTVFVKGCPLKCLWCQNPESQAPFPQLMTYLNKCTGCGACVNACPNGAVTVQNGLFSILVSILRDACSQNTGSISKDS